MLLHIIVLNKATKIIICMFGWRAWFLMSSSRWWWWKEDFRGNSFHCVAFKSFLFKKAFALDLRIRSTSTCTEKKTTFLRRISRKERDFHSNKMKTLKTILPVIYPTNLKLNELKLNSSESVSDGTVKCRQEKTVFSKHTPTHSTQSKLALFDNKIKPFRDCGGGGVGLMNMIFDIVLLLLHLQVKLRFRQKIFLLLSYP